MHQTSELIFYFDTRLNALENEWKQFSSSARNA